MPVEELDAWSPSRTPGHGSKDESDGNGEAHQGLGLSVRKGILAPLVRFHHKHSACSSTPGGRSDLQFDDLASARCEGHRHPF